MNRMERVEAVLSGREADRPPVSMWYHFGVQHGDAETFARATLGYFRHYGFDFLKVMNDYFYPVPPGLDAVSSREDLRRIARFETEESEWKEQLRALSILSRDLSGEAFFIDTVFDPWQTLKRNLACEHLSRLMDEEPEATLSALDTITENLIGYCRKSFSAGSAGIFLSIPAGREILPRSKFLTFVKPFASRLLAAARTLGPMNVAHIHGDDLHFEDCLDLPAQVFNWWDRGPAGPTLAAVKEKFPGCVMGGIDHKIVSRTTRPFLRNHVREARMAAGNRRFFLAGGCSIDTWTFPGALHAIVEAARAPLD